MNLKSKRSFAKIVNQLPNAFTDPKRVTKSYIPAVNAPIRIEVPKEHISANDSKPQLKRGRPIGSKDKNPRKKGPNDQNMETNKEPENVIVEEIPLEDKEPKKVENDEIAMSFTTSGKIWDRKSIIVDNFFAYNIAVKITSLDDEMEPRSVEECKQRNDWKKWKEAIEVELNSLSKREVFGPIGKMPLGIKPVGYKWGFVQERNENNEVVRYRARLVAQGFSQKLGIDYMETYSPVVDSITLRYLMSLAVHQTLDMRLMDVVTTYLYGSLDNAIYKKIPTGLKVPEEYTHSQDILHRETEKILKKFYMDKAHPLSTLMVVRSFDPKKDPFRPHENEEELLGPEVPYLSAIGELMYLANNTRPDISFSTGYLFTSGGTAISMVISQLSSEFPMSDLGLLSFFLGIVASRSKSGLFLSQSAFAQEILARADMVSCNPCSTPTDTKTKLAVDGEPVPDPTLYRSLAGALQYLTFTRPDIAYAVQQVCLFMHDPRTLSHGFHIKASTVDRLVAYSDADWAGCPNTRRSTSGLCVYLGDNLVSWSSKRQHVVSRLSAEAEYRGIANVVAEAAWLRNLLLELSCPLSRATVVFCDNVSAMYLASNPVQHQRTKHVEIDLHFVRERVAIGHVRVLHVPSAYQSITQHIQETCGLPSSKKTPTLVYEDNTACIEQLKQGYVKGDMTKHISPKLLYTHDLQQTGDIDVHQIRSTENLADLFTKALPTSSFEKLVYKIGKRRLREVK
ncbi:hypothetical protein OSB04_006643 [Centaurea solstitialis]|uniref:Reverse transcriptase Ty1/copia-type domain-containing protein n=1 Tax=Centaurea solstitialis TaxID=347529 RepID=A0AA38TQX5_9ASTR|nr:hypothetical protein OSB04_006643 [Centaurea solstitialis]